jgi:hypothetical protein
MNNSRKLSLNGRWRALGAWWAVASLGLVVGGTGTTSGCARGTGARATAGARPSAAGAPDPARVDPLVSRFERRAEECFSEIFHESVGRPPAGADRRATARRKKTLAGLSAELRACLTGRGYRGQAQLGAEVVRRWLRLEGCEAFARAALGSRACFALQAVLEQAGLPVAAAPRRSRPDPRRPFTACANPEPPDARGYLAASHILVFFRGAKRAPGSVTRSRGAARALAARIAARARRPGADFAALARKHSEGPSRVRGGRLGAFPPNRMVPPFSQAVRRLCISQVSDPVLTRFGYHVIRRDRP